MDEIARVIVLCVLTGTLALGLICDGRHNLAIWKDLQQKSSGVDFLRNHAIFEIVVGIIAVIMLASIILLAFLRMG